MTGPVRRFVINLFTSSLLAVLVFVFALALSCGVDQLEILSKNPVLCATARLVEFLIMAVDVVAFAWLVVMETYRLIREVWEWR